MFAICEPGKSCYFSRDINPLGVSLEELRYFSVQKKWLFLEGQPLGGCVPRGIEVFFELGIATIEVFFEPEKSGYFWRGSPWGFVSLEELRYFSNQE